MSEIKKVKLKPKSGLQVRDLNGNIIPEGGISVVSSAYYRRKVKQGDLVVVKETAAVKPSVKTGDK